MWQSGAPPFTPRSAAVRPVTASSKVRLNVTVEAVVGVAGEAIVTVAGVRSIVIGPADAGAAGPGLAARSVTAPEARLRVSVPSLQPVTTTWACVDDVITG